MGRGVRRLAGRDVGAELVACVERVVRAARVLLFLGIRRAGRRTVGTCIPGERAGRDLEPVEPEAAIRERLTEIAGGLREQVPGLVVLCEQGRRCALAAGGDVEPNDELAELGWKGGRRCA